MQISKLNYEAFFLDYWEGNLNDIQKKLLTGFLEKYPELQNDFLDFKDAFALELTPTTSPVFVGREKLKKPLLCSVENINEQNYEQWIVAHLESELTKKQERVYREFISLNSHLKSEVELYKRTFLQPDHRIVYHGKAALKKKNIFFFRQPLPAIVSLAAAILLFVLLFVSPFNYFSGKDEMAGSVPAAPVRTMPIYPQSVVLNNDPIASSVAPNPKAVKIFESKNPDILQPENNSAPLAAKQQAIGSSSEILPDRPATVFHPLAPIHTAQILPTKKAYVGAIPQMKNTEIITDHNLIFAEINNGSMLKRIAENLGQRIFGQKEAENEQASLLTEVANKSIETFNDFKSISFSRANEVGEIQSEAVLALSDRLAIRIKRGNRQVENSY
jgi:hypothetical protein